MEGYIGSTCGGQQISQGGNSGRDTGDNNSDGTPVWLYAVAGGGGLLIVCLLIAGIVIYRRRQAHLTVQLPKPAVSQVPNPLYHGGQGQSLPPNFGAPQVDAIGRIPAALGPLPARPAVDDFQSHNPLFGRPNPVFFPDTLQQPNVVATGSPYDRPPVFDSDTPFHGGDLPSNTTQEDIYDFVE